MLVSRHAHVGKIAALAGGMLLLASAQALAATMYWCGPKPDASGEPEAQCQAVDEEPSRDVQPTPNSQERPVFTITRVSRDATGEPKIEAKTVTREDFMRARSSSPRNQTDAVTVKEPTEQDVDARQVACSSQSVQLYDKSLAECQHGCNLICFEPTRIGDNCHVWPEIYLGKYCHTSACTESWNGLVRSYWVGQYGGTAELARVYGDQYDGEELFYESYSYSYHDAGYGRYANYLYFYDAYSYCNQQP